MCQTTLRTGPLAESTDHSDGVSTTRSSPAFASQGLRSSDPVHCPERRTRKRRRSSNSKSLVLLIPPHPVHYDLLPRCFLRYLMTPHSIIVYPPMPAPTDTVMVQIVLHLMNNGRTVLSQKRQSGLFGHGSFTFLTMSPCHYPTDLCMSLTFYLVPLGLLCWSFQYVMLWNHLLRVGLMWSTQSRK